VSSGFVAVFIGLWVVVLFQGLVIIALMRQLASLQIWADQAPSPAAADRLPAGTPAPRITTRDLRHDTPFDSASIPASAGAVLLFVSPGCPSCEQLISGTRSLPAAGPPLWVVCKGDEEGSRRLTGVLRPDIPLLYDSTGDIATGFGVTTAPLALLLDGERRVVRYIHPRGNSDLMRLGEMLQHMPRAAAPAASFKEAV
jgi:hypothetical protein